MEKEQERKPMQVTIRRAQTKDKEAMEHICMATSTVEQVKTQKALRDAFLMVFCDYYVDHEIENCFVALDEEDVPVGYILCASSTELWQRRMQEGYLKEKGNFLARTIAKGIVKGEAAGMRPFMDRYPAHLHIDILDEYQRMGLGSRLMDTLVSHLHQKEIGGVMLGVAADNEKGKNFYRRYGFTELDQDDHQIIMGVLCTESRL